MREAIGGTMLMYIVLIFLIVYIFFMAVVINYGRVFRVKNTLINYIENAEGLKTDDDLKNMGDYARELGYTGSVHLCYTEGNNNMTYYSVMLYASFQLPLVNNSLNISIAGETSGIRNVEGFDPSNPEIKECNTGNKDLKDDTFEVFSAINN